MLFSEAQQFSTRREVPFSPRCDHFDVWLKRVIGQLETNLIISFARCAMRNGITTDVTRNLDLFLRNQRARNRRAKQIHALVERIGAEHGENVVTTELVSQVFDEDIFGLNP